MKMEEIYTILAYGGVTSLLLSAVILFSLYINPRIWMQDLPKEVQKTIPQKSIKEKKQTLFVSIAFIMILLVLPATAVVSVVTQPLFSQAFLVSYLVYFTFNLTDLLFIDWLVVCTLTPDFIRIEGVDETVYKNYSKHAKDFLKGIILSILPALISAIHGYLIVRYSLL